MKRDSSWKLEPAAAEAAAQAAGGHDDDAEAAAPEAGGRRKTGAQTKTQLHPEESSKDPLGLVGFGERDNQKDV